MIKNIKIAKKANNFLVLDAIRKNQSITIEELTVHTGLSRPTILNILKELQEKEIVSTSGFATTDIGRQPVLYSLNRNSNFAIGIDIDGPPINLVVSNLYGEVVYSKSWEIDLLDEPSTICSRIIVELDKSIHTINIEYKDVISIAIGLPASIDIKNNNTVRLSRIPKWQNYPIHKEVSERTGVKVYIRNDAHLISIAEHEMVNQNPDSLFIVLRSGVGMSAIINDQVYEGAMGNAGYIGHTTLVIDGKECDCGLKGCLETYCSKRAIVKEYKNLTGNKYQYRQILNFADQGDNKAIKVLEDAGKYLGIGISNFIKIYEIYSVILGDMECGEDHVFVKQIIKSAKENLINFSNKEPNIIVGKLTRENFGLGGCYFVLSRFFALPKLQLINKK